MSKVIHEPTYPKSEIIRQFYGGMDIAMLTNMVKSIEKCPKKVAREYVDHVIYEHHMEEKRKRQKAKD